jgi:hypothetical protein
MSRRPSQQHREPRARKLCLRLTPAVCLLAASLAGQERLPHVATAPDSLAQRQPATFYVDAENGDDKNAGLAPDHAWKSLAKLNATTFQPGDTILLKAGGVWAGQLWPKGSGEEDHPIRLGEYGEGPKPAIQGRGLVEDAVLLKNQQYWEIADLDVSNPGDYTAVRRGVHIALDNFGEAHHLVVRRITVHDVYGLDSVKPNGGIIYTAAGEQKPSRFMDLRIEDNEVLHTDRNGITGWSDAWQRSKWFPSLGVVVRGNILRDIGGDGILIVATNGALIEHNLVAQANQRSSGYNVAIWSWSADNTVVQYNEAWGTKGERDGEGFDSDWNSRNTLIQYNYSHENDGGFVLICDQGNNPPGESVGNQGTVVRYNISQNDRNRGITLSGPVKDTLIYNNTIFVDRGAPHDIVLFTDWFGWPQNTQLFNNIFYAGVAARIGHAVSRSEETGHHASAPGLGHSVGSQFSANVYFGNLNQPEDPQAVTANPRFVSPAGLAAARDTLKGFALQKDSPARASGQALPGRAAADFFGTVVSSCAKPDRGAVQSSACDRP